MSSTFSLVFSFLLELLPSGTEKNLYISLVKKEYKKQIFSRHMLMMPWLIYVLCGILTHVTLVLAFMISLADYGSIGVFLASSPGLSIIIYFFLVVYSCYQMIKKEEIR